jgi:hypothetical protein
MMVNKVGNKTMMLFFSVMIAIIFRPQYVESIILNSNPFWMPLEFDIGKGYFKANVFIFGLKQDAGLIRICVNAIATNHKLCHYMNAIEEEGQKPQIAVHGGIFVFPGAQVPIGTKATVCLDLLTVGKIQCKNITSTSTQREQIVDFFM